MNKVPIIIILILIPASLRAQGFDKGKFSSMTLNGVEMADLFPGNNGMNWSFFKSKMGTPLREYESFQESNRKYFEYSGAKFIYDDEQGSFWFLSATITSPNFVFNYDGLQIKVGDNITGLSGRFPRDYGERQDGEIIVFHELGEIWMTINYDSSNVITKIELQQNLI